MAAVTNLVEVEGHLSYFDNNITLKLGRASPGNENKIKRMNFCDFI
jgi:hypothetical protein